MAFTPQELKKIEELKTQGYSPKQIAGHIGAMRLNRESSIDLQKKEENSPTSKAEKFGQLSEEPAEKRPNILDVVATSGVETLNDIKETHSEIKQGVEESKAEQATVDAAFESGEQGGISTGFQSITNFTNSLGKTAASLFKGALKVLSSQEREDAVAGKLQGFGEKLVNVPEVQQWFSNLESLKQESPEQYRNVIASMRAGEFILDITGLKGAGEAIDITAKQAARAGAGVADFASEAAVATKKELQSILDGISADTIDDVVEATIKTADDTIPNVDNLSATAKARALAEADKAKVSFREKTIGITPDVKKQIQGKPEKMAEYIDVVNTRNIDPKAPTVYEFAGDKVRQATTEMEKLLNDTGSQIGATRRRLGNVKASVDQVGNIEKSIVDSLDKLNLSVINGKIVQKPGTIKKVSGAADINALQGQLDQFKIVKQNPTLTNLIDYRNLVQKEINFAKSAREVSDSVDPYARSVRAAIKDEAATIVGKEEAAKLAEYSDFIDAFGEIKSFTDRNAGGEYLLRVVLSGRGGEQRKLLETIKKYTGQDLLDDAVMMKVVADNLANESQKNLFRQEIARAGVDAGMILSGRPSGIVGVALRNTDKLINKEKILLNAAK